VPLALVGTIGPSALSSGPLVVEKPGPAARQLLAWAILALTNAIVVSVYIPLPPGGVRVRVLALAFDLGQHLAIGVVAAASVFLWCRVRNPSRRWTSYVALGSVSLIVAALVLRRDLTSLAGNLGGRYSRGALTALLALASLVQPAMALVGRLATGWRRPLVATVALAGAVVNARLFARNYPGVHLYATWAAATLLASALGDASPTDRPRARPVAWVVMTAVASAALLLRPSPAVLVELLRFPGSALAPFVAAAHASLRRGAAVSRDPEPASSDVPASTPPMLPPDPVIVLLTIDGFRADLLEGTSHARELPNLHALRDGSVYFSQARSPAPHTAPSIAAIFASRFYSQLYWKVHPKAPNEAKTFPHEDASVRFPEVLAAAGMSAVNSASTDGFVGSFGLTRGFTEELRPGWGAAHHARTAIEHLRHAGAGGLFFYAHFMDPHEPYVSGGRAGTDFERYVGEVAVVDREIGRIVEAIASQGLASRTVVIVTGDHGEAFGEHETRFHATTVYEELLRVPLMIRVPRVAPRRVDAMVSLVDLGPTILDLAGLPTPASFMGESLTPFLRGLEVDRRRPVVAESGRQMRAMYFADGMKLITDIATGSVELYDLARDPGELDNRFDEADPTARRRLDALDAYFAAHAYRREGYELPYRP